jgi:hypothetical protein
VSQSPHPARPTGTRLEELAPKLVRLGLAAGIIGLLAAAGLGLASAEGWPGLLHSYLAAFAFFWSLTMGALFFVLLQHLVRAGWSVVVRRLAEAVAMNLPLLALLFLPILFGLRLLYPWADARTVAHDPLLLGKRAYLNAGFFTVRWIVYFGVWSFLALYFWRRSLAQETAAGVGPTLGREKLSAPGMVLFALTLNYASVDLLMSLEPRWSSTIFGVYVFSGGILGFIALLSVIVPLLQRSGRLGGAVTDEHYHDLGKLLFAFTIFWAYIAFSQFMLIWYANLPEETQWFQPRVHGPWLGVSLLLLFGHFLAPFIFLLPRGIKRDPRLLGPAAAWILLMHFADIYWLVMPGHSPSRVPLHLTDVCCVLGLGGFCLAAAAGRLRSHSLIPENDPRLQESLTFENA